jgi:hypothetical protein
MKEVEMDMARNKQGQERSVYKAVAGEHEGILYI